MRGMCVVERVQTSPARHVPRDISDHPEAAAASSGTATTSLSFFRGWQSKRSSRRKSGTPVGVDESARKLSEVRWELLVEKTQECELLKLDLNYYKQR